MRLPRRSRATIISRPISSRAISPPAVPSKIAYIDDRGSVSYGQLAERVERFGHALRSLGIRREERILICLTDTIDWPTAFLGAIKAGVVAVPVNTLLTEDDYEFMLADSRARSSSFRRSSIRDSPRRSPPPRSSPMSWSRATTRTAIARFVIFWQPTRPTRSPRRPRATTCASGSTPRARRAGPRAPCIPTRILSSPTSFTPRPSLAFRRTMSAIRWRSCSSPMGSATRLPSRCRPERPPCCWTSGRRRTPWPSC